MVHLAQEVHLEEEGIGILWNDGHRSYYPYKYLRLRCQCAQCVEEWTRAPLLDPDSIAEDIRAVDHLMVGNYAVQFLWTDAHYTGIYTFEFLRQACPCPECRTRELAS